jgi:pilus assembly protein CpaB
MARRRVLSIIAAIVLALFGTVVIVAYVNSAEDRAQEGVQLVRVLVASEEIEANTPASELDTAVRVEEVPQRLRQPDAVRNIDSQRGKVTIGPIRAGEQIVQRQFGEPDDVRPDGGNQIKKGMEVVSLALEPQRSVGGRLAPGDLVSVIVSVDQAEAQSDIDTTETTDQRQTTGLVLNGVPVTAVSGGVTEEEGEAANAVIVSLEVSGSDAERIVFGMEHGTVWLTLNGENPEPPNDQIRSQDNVYDGIGGAG